MIRAVVAVRGAVRSASLVRDTAVFCRSGGSLSAFACITVTQQQSWRSDTANANGNVSRRPSNLSQKLPDPERVTYRHPTFDVTGRVYIVTGGARGLGLTMAEALAENGAHVYCLDQLAQPSEDYHTLHARLASTPSSGSLNYHQCDVRSAESVNAITSAIASKHRRLDGLAAAAGIQNATPALDYPPSAIDDMLAVNYKGVHLAAVACARQMIAHQTPGSLLLVGSTSGLNAIKGFTASVYCGSKAAVIQLARSLAMGWAKVMGGKPIRVNALCPGNIVTPMVRDDFANDPTLRRKWEEANMLGRISEVGEYKGATLFFVE